MKNEALTILEEATGTSTDEMLKSGDPELGVLNDAFMAACNEIGKVCQLEEGMSDELRVHSRNQINDLKIALRAKVIQAMDKYYNIKWG